MKQFTVTGMSCAACSSRVEKAVSAVKGVESCSVSLLTNSMGVEGSASSEDIIKAVVNAGYNASEKGSGKPLKNDESAENNDMKILKNRLLWSLGFLIILMYFSMGHMMWGFPLPSFFNDNHIAMGLVQLILSALIMIINQKFFINGFKGLLHKSPNMDTLVALGSGASFIYSTYALFAMTDAQLKGNSGAVMDYMHEFYFESAAMILTLITVGKLLETYSKGKTTNALKSLMDLSPKTVNLIVDGKEIQTNAENIKKGDIFVVRSGESIPADAVIIEGSCAVNESALTGESIPVDKNVGDTVSSATINQSGFIKCETIRCGEDTTLSRIIKMVSDASATKAPVAKAADKISGIFVPAVISISVITFIIWLISGQPLGFALERAVSVLVISCPCALGLATPVAIMVGNGRGAKNGILFKTAQSLEQTGKTEIIAFDKTGTITEGKPEVKDIIPYGMTENELLSMAYSIEIKSEHPLAKAITEKAESLDMKAENVSDFKVFAGNGISASVGNDEVSGGNLKFISEKTDISDDVKSMAENLAKDGKTPLFFCRNGMLSGIISVADTIRKDSVEAISELKNMGLHVIMLTGDNKHTAEAIGRQAGVDEVISGVMPDGKESVISSLKNKGHVCMVGDGINDAPALTRADTGIAVGTGTDIAIESADVVIMKSRLKDVPAAIRLSRKTLKNIHENLFWAFIYNVIGIPLAAGLWIPIFGWKLNPMFGAAAMSLSSFCVVTNALRLNLYDIYNASKDKKIKIKHSEKEIKSMKKTISIEGMMCGHCEARVKKCLEKLEQVESAEVSHEKGTAVVTLCGEISDEKLKETIEEQDYTVTSIN